MSGFILKIPTEASGSLPKFNRFFPVTGKNFHEGPINSFCMNLLVKLLTDRHTDGQTQGVTYPPWLGE